MDNAQRIRQHFEEAQDVLSAFLGNPAHLQSVAEAAEAMSQSIAEGGKIISCGNGGSMCDAMHFAEEWTGRFRGDRSALPAIAFSDPSQLSCIANDFGYDEVFARSVQAHGRAGDLLVCLSTSGDSPNTIRALEEARRMGIPSVALLGKDGGRMKDLADLAIIVPVAKTSDRIQELHIKIIHIAIETVERSMFPGCYE